MIKVIINPNTRYLLKCLLIGLWLYLLAQISYGQVGISDDMKIILTDEEFGSTVRRAFEYPKENHIITLKDYDDYLAYCNSDSTEVNQIGYITKEVVPVFIEEKQGTSYWSMEIKIDTVWHNSNESGWHTWAPHERTIYRKVYVKEDPTFKGFYKWLKSKLKEQ